MASQDRPNNVTKKLLNSHKTCATDSLAGLVAWNPGLTVLPKHPNVVLRRDWLSRAKEGKVGIVTGGGSGHEPFCAGFVGEGMATAAVQGDLFTSPSSKSILATLLALGQGGKADVLLVFNNYTGDRLNFGIAAEKARSHGVNVETIVNADDCALIHGADPKCRRGLSGLVLLLKVAGCMADSGVDLKTVSAYIREMLPNVATMGAAWSSCSLPGRGPLFELGHDEMELGLGMHGEAGIKRIKMLNAKDTVSLLLNHMTNKDTPHPFLNANQGDKVVILLNNMGSTSDIEMNVVANEVLSQLGRLISASIDRMYVGRFVTSQEMAGVSITIMTTSEFTNKCLDAKTSALSWVTPVTLGGFEDGLLPWKQKDDIEIEDDDGNKFSDMDEDMEESGPLLSSGAHMILLKALTSISNTMIANTDLLNSWDSVCGDGDCGNTFAAGARGIFGILNEGRLAEERNLKGISNILVGVVEGTMGGTSGGLYSLFLTSASKEFLYELSTSGMTSHLFVRALRRGIDAIMRYGGAVPGDRTMIDPLNAACSFLEREVDRLDTLLLWQQALKVAEQEMQKTKDMEPRVGRASYVHRDSLVHPDPGAKACCMWLRAVVNVLIDNKKHL